MIVKRIPVNRPRITQADKDAVMGALDETFISGDSPPIKTFEENFSKYLGCAGSVSVSSGTTALDLAIEMLNLKPGDTCIVPTFTIISTVSNLLRKKVNLILVDSDPITWSIDVTQAVSLVDEKTKLILPVHIYGLSADMDPIVSIAEKNNVFVLEDAAEALGVEYNGTKCGSIGDASVFSLYANKLITSGEGGLICSDNLEYLERVRYFRNLCFDNKERFVHTDLGWNHRFPALSAALANSQLLRIDKLKESKLNIAKRYISLLEGHPWFSLMAQHTDYSQNQFWIFPILLTKNCPYTVKELQSKLTESGIETRRFFYPIHLQPLTNMEHVSIPFGGDVAENLWRNGMYLPSGLGIEEEEIEIVSNTLWGLVQNSKRFQSF
jgi:perosamine synthetase